MEAREVADAVPFMVTQPQGVVIRDLVIPPAPLRPLTARSLP